MALLHRSNLEPSLLERLPASDVIKFRSLLVGLAAERPANSPPLSDVIQSFLRGIPLWQTHGHVGPVNQLVPLNGLLLAPADVDDVAMLTSRFVKCDPRERALALMTGCPEVGSKAAFLVEHLFPSVPRLAPPDRLQVMTKLLIELPVLKGTATVQAALKLLPFVPPAGDSPASQPVLKPLAKAPLASSPDSPGHSAAGLDSNRSLRRASDLYDPKKAELQGLGLDPVLFPDPNFATDHVLPSLRMLGLRQTVSVDHLLELAERIAKDSKTGPQDKVEARAAALLS